jgi:hypothetical protein
MLTWIDKVGLYNDGTPYFKASVHRVKSINLTEFKIENIDLKNPRWIALPLRLLRIFPVGTLFKGGTVLFKSHLGYIPDFTIDLNTASSFERTTISNWRYGEAFIKAMSWHKLDSGFPKTESKRFAAHSNILVYPNSKRPSADYDFVIFPTSELARFYWFPSTRLFRALMDGKASSDLKNELYVPESALKKSVDGKVGILRSQTSFFRLKVTTFICSKSVDYYYCKAAKKSGHPIRNLHLREAIFIF